MEDQFNGEVSDKAREFVKDLEALCERYGFTLSTSGYDGMQIWLRDKTDASPIYVPFIQDRTKG